MAQIVVLIHLSRSGSTLLSRLLDELDEVGVTIEGPVPDGMTIPWTEITNAASLDRALDALFAQWKFSHWGVDRNALRRRLAQTGYPISVRTWLAAILDSYFCSRPGLKAQVYKRGAYADHLDELHEVAPDAKVIAIVRDPRGAYCSQIRRGSTLGPAWFAKSYNRFVRSVRSVAAEPWVHVVRYEELAARPEAEIARVAAFVGADPTHKRASNYVGQIPASQSHLHDRLSGPVDATIADEWRTRLGSLSTICIEHLCRDSMAAEGYAPVRKPPGPVLMALIVMGFRGKLLLDYLARLSGADGPEEARHAWRRLLGRRSRRPDMVDEGDSTITKMHGPVPAVDPRRHPA
jgi:hypothetical protein